MFNSLEIILKVAERCNLNCSYCYFFNRGDLSYKDNPVTISNKTIHNLIVFLKQAHTEYGIKNIKIDFHGGEPLLKKKQDFDKMCEILLSELSPYVNLYFTIQTNGILIDQDWIEIFSKYKITVGISLDGNKEINDIYRIDHYGKGSYDRVTRGLKLCLDAKNNKKLSRVGVLSVININSSAEAAYKHLVNDLKLDYIDFLLPDYTHNDFNANNVLVYGKFLCELFNYWVQDNNPKVKIRILSSILKLVLGGKSEMLCFGPKARENIAVTVSSNGNLLPDDTLRPIYKFLDQNTYNISDVTLKNFIESSGFFHKINTANNLPKVCTKCKWMKVCNAGSLINRYKKDNFFDNPSIYCKDLQLIYEHIYKFLLTNGYISKVAC